MQTVIELKNVTKAYGSSKAVDGLSLSVEQGTVLALLGPNGAGKTTTISMMLGLKRPTVGTVKLMGGDPREAGNRSKIGAILQEVDVIDRLKVLETIELFRSYYEKPMAADRLLQLAGLEKEAGLYAEKLSGGQKRRLQFALALAGDPQVIFLDEPTVGMDVSSRQVFWDMLRALAKGGGTIILTTHYLEEADAIADRVVVINHGKVVADGTPDQLKTTLGGKYVGFIAGSSVTDQHLQALPEVNRVEWSGRHVKLYTNNTDRVLYAVVESGLDIRDIQVTSGGLNDVFQNLVEAKGAKIS